MSILHTFGQSDLFVNGAEYTFATFPNSLLNFYNKSMLKLTVIQCNITKLKVDAIVNAANHTLLGGVVEWMVRYTAPQGRNCSKNAARWVVAGQVKPK